MGGTALSAQAPSRPGQDLWGANPSVHARGHTPRDFFLSSGGFKAGRGSCHHGSGDSPTPTLGYLKLLSRHERGQPHTRPQSRQAAALRRLSPHPSLMGGIPASPHPPNTGRDRTRRRLRPGAGPARPPRLRASSPAGRKLSRRRMRPAAPASASSPGRRAAAPRCAGPRQAPPPPPPSPQRPGRGRAIPRPAPLVPPMSGVHMPRRRVGPRAAQLP